VYKLAEKMVRLNPELWKIVKPIPSQKTLIGLPMNVEYEAISAEAGTAYGLSPIVAILGEVGQVEGPYDAFVEAIETAQGAHDNPILLAAATDADLFSVWLDDAEKSKDPLFAAPHSVRARPLLAAAGVVRSSLQQRRKADHRSAIKSLGQWLGTD
jgi:hypothetical protein